MKEGQPNSSESEITDKSPENTESSVTKNALGEAIKSLGDGAYEAISLLTEPAAEKVADALIAIGKKLEVLRSKSTK